MTATSRVKHFYSHAKFGGFDYDNNADCDWAIEAEPGRNVQLTFLTFDVRFFCLFANNDPATFIRLFGIRFLFRLKTKKLVRMTMWKCLAVWTTTVVPYMVDIVEAL